MAETSKNKIYYNDNENSVADVLADMKKMAESTDEAIEKSKYNDAAIKKSISDVEKKQVEKDTEQDSKIVELQTEKAKLETELKEIQEDFYQNSIRGQASGEYIHVEDSSNCRARIGISGNSEQETRSGKNLLNFNGFATKEISGVTITNNNDGSITLNGTATATISIKLSNQMNKTLTAGNYYFSRNSKGSVSGAFTNFMFGNNDAEDIKFATITEENKGFSTSIDYKKYWLWLYINSGITFTNYIMKPQLEAGTVKTNWELYGAMPSPDYPSEIKTVGSNGFVKVTKCNKNIWNLGNKGNNSGDIRFPLKSGKYTLSFKKKRIRNSTITNEWVYRYAYIRFYDKNDTLLSSIKDGMAINLTANQTSDRQIIDFTAPENTVKMIVNFSNNNGDNNNNTEAIEIQLEGEKATSFEQHKEQSYIMPVQKEMLEEDYFDWDNEEEVHIWNKLILDGTESIEKFQYSDNTFLIAKGAKNVNASEILVKSNMFMGVSYNNRTISRNYIIYVEIETGNIIFRNTSYSALADFKTWLKSQYDAGTPVVIYYKLATPTRLPFTDEQKAVAKELNNARTYKNVTNITTDSKAILSLDYAKDLETLLNNTQALAVNNASEGV